MRGNDIGFLDAVKKDDVERAKKWLDDGANVNVVDEEENGDTAIIIAVFRKNLPMVQELLKRGADPNAQNYNGGTALIYAVYARNPDIFKALIDGGADVNARDDKGYTPLMHASFFGYMDEAQKLVAAGADVNLTNAKGAAAVDVALLHDQKELADFLVSKGATITKKQLDEAMVLQYFQETLERTQSFAKRAPMIGLRVRMNPGLYPAYAKGGKRRTRRRKSRKTTRRRT